MLPHTRGYKLLWSKANFQFRGPRLFVIGGPSGRLATADVIRISTRPTAQMLVTFTEQVVPIHKHITSFWIPSISGIKQPQWN